MPNKDVTFIRRGGRVIPIRKKDAGKQLVKRPGAPPRPKPKERKSLFKSAGLFGLGAVSSLFGGSALAEFSKEASHKAGAAKSLFSRGSAIKKQAQAVSTGVTGSIGSKDAAFLTRQAKTFTKAGAFQRARGAAIGKQGKIVGGLAIGVGSVLVGYGLSQAAEELFGHKLSAQEEVLATVAGGIATSAAAIEFGSKMNISAKAAKKVIQALLKRGF